MAPFECAPVVRVRHSSKSWRSCSATIFGSYILVPLGLFSSFHQSDVVARDSPLEIECSFHSSDSWRQVFVDSVIPLWKMCPELKEISSSDVASSSLSLGLTVLDGESDAIVFAGTLVLLKAQGGVPESIQTRCIDDLSVGETIDVYGSPFPGLLGRKCMASRFQAFVSCVLHGDGSTSMYTGPALYLLDAPGCVPGTEGGPLVRDTTVLCGCLGYAISSSSLGASFHIGWPLRLIAHVLCYPTTNALATLPRDNGVPPVVTVSTVSIHLDTDKSAWASGFLIQPCVVVTNAHAVDINSRHVTVIYHDGTKHDAYVRYNLDGIIDLAFLDVPTLDSYIPHMPQCQPEMGHSIVVSGFPLWNPILCTRECSSPKLTSGTVTGNLRDSRGVAAFMTDAQVINGASGGPIVHISDDSVSFLGLACSNARVVTRHHPENKSVERIYPTLNFCIPSHCIYTAHHILYGKSKGANALREVRETFRETTTVWRNIHACSDTPLSKI